MFKFLVVGCGGSGGTTLRYMMDKLKSELARYGVRSLPSGWQFVHIDVPDKPDNDIRGLGKVPELGGKYITLYPNSPSYENLDAAVTPLLQANKELGEVATWVPTPPSSVDAQLDQGAGQLRAVGRMVTLAKAHEIKSGLDAVIAKLLDADSSFNEMIQAGVPGLGSLRPGILTLVVSSMAGGSGASMALDVCRILANNQAIGSKACIFMVGADVFDKLPSGAQKGGVRANALAMLGEIVATQAGTATSHDLALLNAMGLSINQVETLSFAKVFPVSAKRGAGAPVGNGTPNEIYRNLGSGLAALMLSGVASADFAKSNIENPPVNIAFNQDLFGWGNPGPDRYSWGAFGFGSLSMGRDRYQHYASQRLARSAVDVLTNDLRGEDLTIGAEQAIRERLDANWNRILDRLGLPVPGVTKSLKAWLGTQKANQDADTVYRQNVANNLTQPAGTGQAWLQTLKNTLSRVANGTAKQVDDAAYKWAFDWSQSLYQKVLAEVDAAVANMGIPYARALVERLSAYLSGSLSSGLKNVVGPSNELTQPPEQVVKTLGRLTPKQQPPAGVLEQFKSGYLPILRDSLEAKAAAYAAEVCQAMPNGVLRPLGEALTESLKLLDQAVGALPSDSGLANVDTTEYSLWPDEHNPQVNNRFGVSENEVLLTPHHKFGEYYQSHLTQLFGPTFNLERARQKAVAEVVTGEWKADADGARPPGSPLERKRDWHPQVFSYDPETGADLQKTDGSYAFHLTPEDMLRRTKAFIDRNGEKFKEFCTVSLGDYALGKDGAKDSEMKERQADIAEKFVATLNKALPLATIDQNAVNKLYNGSDLKYQFEFSEIPFKNALPRDENTGKPVLVSKMRSELEAFQQSQVGRGTLDTFDRVLTDETSKVTRIDVFGSYDNYVPLVFTSVLDPIAEELAKLRTNPSQVDGYWRHRRARPLAAALPMRDEERRAMITGWYIAQMTGRLKVPAWGTGEAVQLYDDQSRSWLSFPNPLLIPPRLIRNDVDWLAAVLQSILIAQAEVIKTGMASLKPYQVLRAKYDNAPTPTPHERGEHLAAVHNLANWLADGWQPSGTTAAPETLAERYEKVQKFVTGFPEQVRALFKGPLVSRDQCIGDTSGPGQSQTLYLRDFANDIIEGLTYLAELLPIAKREAEAIVAGGKNQQFAGLAPASSSAAATSVIPTDFGKF